MTGKSDPSAPGAPVHEQVYGSLKALILFGDLAPGQAVTIQGLTARLGAGSTPVREALRRLISEGALKFGGNRRIQVPVLDRTALDDLTFLRMTIEPELAARAARIVGPGDIAQLRAIDTALDRAIVAGDISGYLRGNHDFHATLYALANAPILHDIVDGLWLRFGPSLRVVCGRLGTRALPDMHKALLTALTEQDADRAADAMRADIEQGMHQIARGTRDSIDSA